VAVITAALSAPAVAALPNSVTFTSIDSVGRWIANYRAKPDPMRLPAMVRALSQIGAFKEPEAAGVYVGFIAGVIGANPGKAEELVGKMITVAPAEHWVIVRAIAYSNHPDWKGLLRKFADRMPLRQVMIDKYLDGKLATLDEIPLEKKKLTLWDKVRGHFQREHDTKVAEEALASELNEIVEAAETMQTTRLRKDALASIEELKRKGPGSKRDISNWGQIGQGALALGCIAAAATGHIEFGLPCVIGGAASSAALSYWNNQQ